MAGYIFYIRKKIYLNLFLSGYICPQKLCDILTEFGYQRSVTQGKYSRERVKHLNKKIYISEPTHKQSTISYYLYLGRFSRMIVYKMSHLRHLRQLSYEPIKDKKNSCFNTKTSMLVKSY